MKINSKKIWMTLIIFIISLCSCFFFNKVSAADLYYGKDKITKEQLETFSSATLDRLQIAASNSNKNDLFFQFDIKKLVKSAKDNNVEITAGIHEQYYFYWNKSVCCISPEDHLMAWVQRAACVIDCPGDGTVSVARLGSKGKAYIKTTEYKGKSKTAVQRAYEMAYYAAKAVERGEGPRKEDILG